MVSNLVADYVILFASVIALICAVVTAVTIRNRKLAAIKKAKQLQAESN